MEKQLAQCKKGNSDRLADLLHHNTDWVWEVDAAGRYVWVSDVVKNQLGYTPEEVLGRTPFDFMLPDEAERLRKVFGEVMVAQKPFSGMINRNRRADGSVVVIETSAIPLFDELGALSGFRGIDRDITQLSERVLQLESIYQNTPLALCIINRDGQLTKANKAMGVLLGEPEESLVGKRLEAIMPEWQQLFQQDFMRIDSGEELASKEVSLRGRYYYIKPQPMYDAGGNAVGISAAWMDITERKLVEQQLASANQTLLQFAERDHLTGLFNRRYMDDRLSYEISGAQREGASLSLCMADIDFFKHYNDTYGHQAGDRVLRAVADALMGALRPGDCVSRYGGEEFLIMLPDTDAKGALSVAERLRERVMALEIEHKTSPIGGILTISLGVMTWDSPKYVCSIQSNADISADLISSSDTALYQAKQQGRNRVAVA
ncbi:sensor domain-containing diguanylate cyclase [Kluyvera genomosp. 1]|uniref:sensor domain-containing diguanylate cyclase n=1 Tax=Kluyvera genomosp. 1 TaxID=2774053 RepID=UPI00068F2CD1|nr:GGDEF domain-containing protein [Kluyvera genomosp. 1]